MRYGGVSLLRPPTAQLRVRVPKAENITRLRPYGRASKKMGKTPSMILFDLREEHKTPSNTVTTVVSIALRAVATGTVQVELNLREPAGLPSDLPDKALTGVAQEPPGEARLDQAPLE